jgi:RNA recognition motif-containing protein
MNLYVSNLSFQTTEESLNEMFSKYGKVNSIKIILDKETQRPRGFAFVEMSSNTEGSEAISALNNKEVGGRMMGVAVAKEKSERNNNSFYQRRNDNKRW